MARAIAVTSGKGGVGKTNAATNIGIALSRLGRRVCIFDADLGLANVNILTGQVPTRTLEHVVDGTSTIDEIILDGPGGIRVVPAGSGSEKLYGLDPAETAPLKEALEKLERDHDYLIIDTAAGLGRDVLGFVSAAHEALVVVSPEPTSMTDAYALVKVLHRQGYRKDFSVLVNMASGEEEGNRIFSSFNNATKKFLGRELKLAGHVVRDYALASSVLKQVPVSVLYPESAASQCFSKIALVIDSGYGPNGVGAFSGAWLGGFAAHAKSQAEKRISAAAAGEKDLEALKRWIETQAPDEAAAREALSGLESAFMGRFGKPYADFRKGLLSLLDFSDVSQASIKEAALLLESIYERRFGKPLFEAEDALIKALCASDSPARIQNLIVTMENSSFKRFGTKPLSLEARIAREGEEGSLDPVRLSSILELINKEHLRLTGAPLTLEGSIRTEEVLPLLARVREGEERARTLSVMIEELKKDHDETLAMFEKLVSQKSDT